MALKKYGKTVVVQLTGSVHYEFEGANGIAAYNALMNHEQIVANGTANGEVYEDVIIPYHAVVYATITLTSETAEPAEDEMCVTD